MSKPNRPQSLPASTHRTASQLPIQQRRATPVAPPVYRPQPAPKVLQPKATAPQLKKVAAAPPVYRPHPVPKVLQRKVAAVPPPANTARRTPPAAPPVYRPQPAPRVLQPKAAGAAAPPVYRPQPLPKVLQRKSNQPQPDSRGAARPGWRPGAIQPKATPQPPPAYRPQPVPACLRSSRPAAPTVQRKIIINGKDVDKNAGAKTLLENCMKQYGLEKADDVYVALKASASEFKYDSEDEVVAEIKVRQNIASGIVEIENHAGYNLEGDKLRLGNQWNAVAGISGDEESDAHVFRPTGKASDAINQLFSTAGNHLECNSATVAVHYHALLKTMGAEAFDAAFEDQVVVMPDMFVKIYEYRDQEDGPSLGLIQKVEVKSEDNLVKGDWVYFMNYPEYEEINKLLNDKDQGAFEGENAIYLGKDRYKGFGVDNVNFNGMVKMLKDEYNDLVDEYVEKVFNKDTHRNKVQKYYKKQAREANAETLDGEVPGIESISVRRVMANQYVRSQAGMGVRELLAKQG